MSTDNNHFTSIRFCSINYIIVWFICFAFSFKHFSLIFTCTLNIRYGNFVNVSPYLYKHVDRKKVYLLCNFIYIRFASITYDNLTDMKIVLKSFIFIIKL